MQVPRPLSSPSASNALRAAVVRWRQSLWNPAPSEGGRLILAGGGRGNAVRGALRGVWVTRRFIAICGPVQRGRPVSQCSRRLALIPLQMLRQERSAKGRQYGATLVVPGHLQTTTLSHEPWSRLASGNHTPIPISHNIQERFPCDSAPSQTTESTSQLRSHT